MSSLVRWTLNDHTHYWQGSGFQNPLWTMLFLFLSAADDPVLHLLTLKLREMGGAHWTSALSWEQSFKYVGQFAQDSRSISSVHDNSEQLQNILWQNIKCVCWFQTHTVVPKLFSQRKDLWKEKWLSKHPGSELIHCGLIVTTFDCWVQLRITLRNYSIKVTHRVRNLFIQSTIWTYCWWCITPLFACTVKFILWDDFNPPERNPTDSIRFSFGPFN